MALTGGEFFQPDASEPEDNMEIELERWLSVSGDMDDFIFYGDDAGRCSER